MAVINEFIVKEKIMSDLKEALFYYDIIYPDDISEILSVMEEKINHALENE